MVNFYYDDLKLVEKLKFIIKKKKMVHSYLFYGEERTKNIQLAKTFAQAILCEGEEFLCGCCHCCKQFSSSNHADFVEVGEKELVKQSFNVNDARKLISDCYIKPNDGLNKIFLLKNVDNLLKSSANVLLKILEEPPKGVIFLMTAKNKYDVLPTIWSRSVSFFVSVNNETDCLNFLNGLDINFSEEKKQEILSLAQGKMELIKFYALEEAGEKVLNISKDLFNAYLKQNEFRFLYIFQNIENDVLFCENVLDCFLNRILIFIEKNFSTLTKKYIEKLSFDIECFEKVIMNLKNNINLSVALSFICCKIFN